MNWMTFYAPVMWTLGFWAWGDAYTIVPNRHVGLDIGTNRRAVDVPALVGGRVIIVTKTRSMAWVVVLDTGLPGSRRYHAYCHLSAVNLPRAGTWINRNARVAKLAAGARDYDDPEFPGTAWGGIHLHLVMCDVAHGAYTLNTGARFANPEDLIRELLTGQAAGGDAKPFPDNPKEWDEMASEEQVKQAAKEATLEALREVSSNDVPRGVYIWTRNRGGALIDPAVGGVKLAGEEAEVARAIYGHGPELNDRQWDVALNLADRLAEKNADLVAEAIAKKNPS